MTQKNTLKQLVANHRISKNSKDKNKTASLYIKNGAIISNRKPIKYPNYLTDKDFKFTVKNLPTKLSQNTSHFLNNKINLCIHQRVKKLNFLELL